MDKGYSASTGKPRVSGKLQDVEVYEAKKNCPRLAPEAVLFTF
jgi:hypothetical protein